jgi:hypothetical protein
VGAVVTVEVPDGSATDGGLGFAILALGDLEIMLQKDAFRAETPQTVLFVEVTSLDAIESSLSGERRVMPRSTPSSRGPRASPARLAREADIPSGMAVD